MDAGKGFQFQVHITKNGILVDTDPGTAKDLVMTLEILLDLAQSIRSKARNLESQRRALSQAEIAKRKMAFQEKALRVWATFQAALRATDGDQKAAQAAARKDHGLRGYELSFYLSGARGLLRRKPDAMSKSQVQERKKARNQADRRSTNHHPAGEEVPQVRVPVPDA